MLQHEQLREVLARAEEIQQQASYRPSQAELDEVVAAAEEAGLGRAAVEQALRERLSLMAEAPKTGDRVFARSADDNFYLARVVSTDGHMVRVRFAKGGEHALSLTDIRPAILIPGQKVVVNWPSWGWWTCKLVSHDPENETIRATDGFSEEVFPLSEVRLASGKPNPIESILKDRIGVVVATAVVSGGLGALITWFVSR